MLPTPYDAVQESKECEGMQRADWYHVHIGIMEEVLDAKFRQHPHLRDELLRTRHRELIYGNPVRGGVLWFERNI